MFESVLAVTLGAAATSVASALWALYGEWRRRHTPERTRGDTDDDRPRTISLTNEDLTRLLQEFRNLKVELGDVERALNEDLKSRGDPPVSQVDR